VVARWLDQLSDSTLGPVRTGMGDRLWVGKPPRFVTNHSAQLSLLPLAGRKMSTSQSAVTRCNTARSPTFIGRRRRSSEDALRLGSKGRYVSFHLWINVWVAGKT